MNNIHYDAWYYVIYLIPGGAATLLILLSALGGGRHGHHAHMPHAHMPHTGMGHTHVPHGALGHAGGQTKTHTPAKGVKAREMPQALAYFGFGRVPTTLAWGSFLLGWGLFGFWATRLLEPALRFPALFALPAFAAAIAGGMGASRLTAYLWTRLLPVEETFVTGTVDLCGQTGTAVYPVDEAHGRAHVYDAFGTLHDVSARTTPGQPAIVRGRTILVIDYDAERSVILVEELP